MKNLTVIKGQIWKLMSEKKRDYRHETITISYVENNPLGGGEPYFTHTEDDRQQSWCFGLLEEMYELQK